MGLITRNWLKANPEINQPHGPAKVTFSVAEQSHDWAKKNEVVFAVTATKPDGNHQVIYFTQQDLATILPSLCRGAGEATLKDVAFEGLKRLKDKDFLEVLRFALIRRDV